MTNKKAKARRKRSSTDPIIDAHRFSDNHREALRGSNFAGCFFCCSTWIFDEAEITEWIDNDTTAMCPRCGIDSVIGDKDVPELSLDLLEKMSKYWFASLHKIEEEDEEDNIADRGRD